MTGFRSCAAHQILFGDRVKRKRWVGHVARVRGEERCGVGGDIWRNENTRNTRQRRNDNIKIGGKEDRERGLN